MTHAELLRSHADLAIKEGGMYYSGEYLSRIAKTAESLEAENAHLRELVRDMWRDIPKSESCRWDTDTNCCSGSDECKGECAYWYRMRKLGIEVEECATQ